MLRIALAAAVLLASAPAHAWDGPRAWYDPADGASPGGGGIFGVGGARDHGITCLDCHVERADTEIDLRFDFTPPLQQAGDELRYSPGQLYEIDVTMLGESLGPPCDQYMTHVNNFAATFENAEGQTVGVLESDSGQAAGSCPADYPDPTTGTTALYRDCRVVFSRGVEDIAQWKFYWRAPTAGPVRMYYGGVDGNCEMDSFGDAVVAGDLSLFPSSGVAPAGTSGSLPGALAGFAQRLLRLFVVGLVL